MSNCESGMRGVTIISAVSIVLLGLAPLTYSRPRNEEDEVHHEGGREKRETGYGWKHTEYLIATLKQQLNNNDLYFCNGDAFKGVQCPEEALCAQWEQLCDGTQTCGLEVREACINSTVHSYGRTDDRFCAGDENPKWCHWKRQAPIRCGEDFVIRPDKKRKRFRIRSPDYPNNYLTDRYCYWTVKTEPGRTLSVHFMRFATEANYDYLSIGQGLRRDDERTVLIYKHSGNRIPADFKTNPRMPKANELWITFRSDDWDNDAGFIIEVTDQTFYDAQMVINNPLRTPPSRECGEIITIPDDGEVTVRSPASEDDPNYYVNHVYCTWTLSVRRGRRIEARFILFDLEDGEDFLSLGNGAMPRRFPLFYRKTGNIRTYSELRHISSSSDMWLIFEASVAIARQGFVAKFTEVPISDCGGTLTVPDGGSIAVASRNYPSLAYSSNMDCTWRIINEAGRRLWVSFQDFNTEWQRDFVSFGNGPEPDENRTTAVVSSHSGIHLPDPAEFMSRGSEVWMTFMTNRYSNYRGFKVDIYDELVHPAPVTTAEPTTEPRPTKPPRRPSRPRSTKRPKPKLDPVVLPGMEPAPNGGTDNIDDFWTWTTRSPPTTTRRTPRPRPRPRPRPVPRRTTTTKRPTTTRRPTTTTRRPTTTLPPTTTTLPPTTTRRTTTLKPTTTRRTTTRRPTTTVRTTLRPTTTRRTTTAIITTAKKSVFINPWAIPSESSSSSSLSYTSSLDSSSQSQFV